MDQKKEKSREFVERLKQYRLLYSYALRQKKEKDKGR